MNVKTLTAEDLDWIVMRTSMGIFNYHAGDDHNQPCEEAVAVSTPYYTKDKSGLESCSMDDMWAIQPPDVAAFAKKYGAVIVKYDEVYKRFTIEIYDTFRE